MEESLEIIVGKTIERITEEQDDTILFECSGEDAFQAYHLQDCCEYVRVFDIEGNLQDLVGLEITSVSEQIIDDVFPADMGTPNNDSWTVTIHTFEAGGVKVRVRWLGESNGYYSESVYFTRTHKPIR